MPVNIITTKEERIERLVKELKDAGLVITNMQVEYDSFPSNRFGDGYYGKVVGQRRVSATIEVVGSTPEDTYEMLQTWMNMSPQFKVYR